VDYLNRHFDQGMTGASKSMEPMIAQAAHDTGLSVAQIKVSPKCLLFMF